MMDKPETAEAELPPPCHDCRSLHKKYGSFLCARRQARYQARGGEYLLLLIPPIYYAAKRTLLDWIADLRRAKGRRERSAESEYTL